MGRKFTIFALFYFEFESKFNVQAPRGAYIRRGDLTEGFLRYNFEGLIRGGAYFRNFTVFNQKNSREVPVLVDVATTKQSLIVHTLHLSLTFHYDCSYPVSPL